MCLDCIKNGWGAECLVNGTVGGVSGTISISEYHLTPTSLSVLPLKETISFAAVCVRAVFK